MACAFCDEYDEAVFRELRECPKCHRDLLAEVEERSRSNRESDPPMVHVLNTYGEARPSAHSVDQREISAHDYLEYARLRGQIARTIERVFGTSKAPAVVGFLTGSVGLSVDARRLLAERGVEAFHFLPGLAHVTERGDPTNKLTFASLLDRLKDDGCDHVVLLDELVSGGQLWTDLKTACEWFDAQAQKPELKVTVICGVRR